jgi:KDO2-lipid IV(A) lauroyltransferase
MLYSYRSCVRGGYSILKVKLFRFISWLCYYTPAWLRYYLAGAGGQLYYWLVPGHSRYADQSMQIVLQEPKINRRVRRMAQASFRNYARYMADFLRLRYVGTEEVKKVAIVGGWNNLDEALNRGKGVLMITPHFGNWDIAISLAAERGVKINSVANDFEPPELNTLIQNIRRKQGLYIYSPKESLRGLYTSLKKNGVVALLFDSPLPEKEEGIVVDFFGKPARFPSGPARLAYQTSAAVMLVYVARQPGKQRFYGMWEPHLTYELDANREVALKTITQIIAHELEELIRLHPDQWYMFRKLWVD